MPKTAVSLLVELGRCPLLGRSQISRRRFYRSAWSFLATPAASRIQWPRRRPRRLLPLIYLSRDGPRLATRRATPEDPDDCNWPFFRHRPRSNECGRVAVWQNSNPDVGTISTTGLLTQSRSRNDHNHSDLSREVWILVFHHNISISWAVGLLRWCYEALQFLPVYSGCTTRAPSPSATPRVRSKTQLNQQ